MSSISLESAWATLQRSDSHSLLKKCLTSDVYEQLKDAQTSSGATLLDVIRSGVKNLDSSIGLYAADADSYRTFAPLFDAVIAEYNFATKALEKRHPAAHFGDPRSLRNIDPHGKHILSTRIRCARNFSGFPFNPSLTQSQYEEIEDKAKLITSSLGGDLNGEYLPLPEISEDVRQQFVDQHLLFKNGDRFMEAANATRFWPAGRGMFHNSDKTFLIWVNEEDHLRIISLQKGADLQAVYSRFVAALQEFERSPHANFAHDGRLGFLANCPTNIGTTIRTSVHIKLPALNEDRIKQIAAKWHLDVRGTDGEHSETREGVYDISNKRRFGVTEIQVMLDLQNGVAALIDANDTVVTS